MDIIPRYKTICACKVYNIQDIGEIIINGLNKSDLLFYFQSLHVHGTY
jgi:hypothetical protein